MKTLEELQAGDHVWYTYFGARLRPMLKQVVAVTDKRIRIEGMRELFDRTTGRGYGTEARIKSASEADVAAWRKREADEAAENKKKAAAKEAHEATEVHQLADRISNFGWRGHEEWEKVPIEQLRQRSSDLDKVL
jgi:hypothetical protein